MEAITGKWGYRSDSSSGHGRMIVLKNLSTTLLSVITAEIKWLAPFWPTQSLIHDDLSDDRRLSPFPGNVIDCEFHLGKDGVLYSHIRDNFMLLHSCTLIIRWWFFLHVCSPLNYHICHPIPLEITLESSIPDDSCTPDIPLLFHSISGLCVICRQPIWLPLTISSWWFVRK